MEMCIAITIQDTQHLHHQNRVRSQNHFVHDEFSNRPLNKGFFFEESRELKLKQKRKDHFNGIIRNTRRYESLGNFSTVFVVLAKNFLRSNYTSNIHPFAER